MLATGPNRAGETMLLQSVIARRWWDARRFGVSPDKWRARLTNRSEPSIFCNAIPKSGTHLIERALCLHPQIYRRIVPTIYPQRIHRYGGLYKLLSMLGPGEMAVGHFAYSEDNQNFVHRSKARCFFMIRDPRDIVVSYANYLVRDRNNTHHQLFANLPDMKSRLLLAIEGYPPNRLPSIQAFLNTFYGWISSGALVVRFEDLVGAAGGGKDDIQFRTVQSMYEHLGMPLADPEIKKLTMAIFSKQSPTFHSGAIGKWRKDFDEQVIHKFKEIASDTLVQYGYELDDRW